MKRIFLLCLILILPLCVYPYNEVFKVTTPLNTGRQMYGSVVVGDYLYMISGNMDPDIFTTSVEKAKINPDGTIGAWQQTTPLPSPRSYINNTTLYLNGVIYIVQGLNGNSNSKHRTILWSRPGQDGHLATWRESEPCPGDGVSCSVAVATPGFIHLIGGSIGGSKPIDTVWSAQIGQDDSIVKWEQGPLLPAPLWFHCGGLAEGKVWIWGGLFGSTSSSLNKNIFASRVLPDGRLTPWQDTGFQLDTGFYSASCTVSGDYLLSFCPRYKDAAISGDVWYSVVGSQGLSPWEKLNCDIPSKLYIGVATNYKLGIVYLPGGRFNKGSHQFDKNVYYFCLAVGNSGAGQTQTAEASSEAAHAPPGASPQMASGSPASNSLSGNVQNPYPGVNANQSSVFLSFEQSSQQYLQNPRPTVIYFYSDVNADCQNQAQILSQAQLQSYSGKVIFTKVNVYDHPDLVDRYNVTRVPFWFFYNSQGAQVAQKDTIIQANELVQILGSIAP